MSEVADRCNPGLAAGFDERELRSLPARTYAGSGSGGSRIAGRESEEGPTQCAGQETAGRCGG